MKINFFFLLFFVSVNCQSIDVNNLFFKDLIRFKKLNQDSLVENSLTIWPISSQEIPSLFDNIYNTLFSNTKKSIYIKSLGIDYFSEYNTRHPYNRNNGSMIPNRGFQHIFSPGLYFKIGPISIKFKPEHHFSENKKFDGFWEGHYPVIWAERYNLWNHIDLPERFGEKRHNKTYLGQSSIRINWKNISLGISNENIWWGPAFRNSIMMSNNARGFKHITFNTIKPFKTIIGNFEWQVITGRLENSGFTPPRTDFEYAGTKLYIPKINQLGETDDWRYLQGFILAYSPKWIEGITFGLTRWVQMYSALVRGKYTWMTGKPTFFPAFKNLFRKNDQFENYEAQTDQAAGIFLKWNWNESKSNFYFELNYNDSKQNFRDLLLDSDHSRAVTVGLEKIFLINDDNFLFNWEWTQMEQSASRLIRNSGSWYRHIYVYDGYTNKGEVLGSSIGPGSNSHYLSVNKINKNNKLGIGFEIVDQDNDFFHEAFASAKDFRRYWKDFNFHLNFNKKFKNLLISTNIVYNRSLNYQWELDDYKEPYYHPGKDVDNFHFNLQLTYFGL